MGMTAARLKGARGRTHECGSEGANLAGGFHRDVGGSGGEIAGGLWVGKGREGAQRD